MEPNLIGVPLSEPRPVRPLGRAKFNYRLQQYCRPQKLLVPASVYEDLLITDIYVGEVPFEGSNVELRRVERGGAVIGYEMILPEVEAARGQQVSVLVENKTRKVVLFYVVAVLAILDEQKLLEAVMGQALELPGSDLPALLVEGGAAPQASAGWVVTQARRLGAFIKRVFH